MKQESVKALRGGLPVAASRTPAPCRCNTVAMQHIAMCCMAAKVEPAAKSNPQRSERCGESCSAGDSPSPRLHCLQVIEFQTTVLTALRETARVSHVRLAAQLINSPTPHITDHNACALPMSSRTHAAELPSSSRARRTTANPAPPRRPSPWPSLLPLPLPPRLPS